MAFKFMNDEDIAKYKARRARIAERRATLESLSDVDLADRLEYTLINGEITRRYKRNDLVTYDDALVLTYLPELLRRLRGKEETNNNYTNLAKRLVAQKNKELG